MFLSFYLFIINLIGGGGGGGVGEDIKMKWGNRKRREAEDRSKTREEYLGIENREKEKVSKRIYSGRAIERDIGRERNVL